MLTIQVMQTMKQSKLQEIGYKEFYIYHEPTDTYIPY